jgi:hypothetical protein
MSTQEVIEQLAELISDYRKLPKGLSPIAHVARWAGQFPEESRCALIGELLHVLGQTYFSRDRTIRVLTTLAETDLSGGTAPREYWRTANLLHLQDPGHSQSDLLACLPPSLGKARQPRRHVYLDDFLLSGTRAIQDLGEWLAGVSVREVSLTLVFLVACTHGRSRVHHRLQQIAQQVGVNLTLNWWHVVEIDDHHARFDTADVLRPAEYPSDSITTEFVERVRPRLRLSHSNSSRLFRDGGRAILERELVVAGLELMTRDRFTRPYVRPLGMQLFPTFGFGLVAATWRHCPNHCPLPLWVRGSEWEPLFPRDPDRQNFELFHLTDAMFDYPPPEVLSKEPTSKPIAKLTIAETGTGR